MKTPLFHRAEGKFYWKDAKTPFPLFLLIFFLAALLHNPTFYSTPQAPWLFFFIPLEALTFLAFSLCFMQWSFSPISPPGKGIYPKLFYGAILLYTAFSLVHILTDFPRHGFWNMGLILFPAALLLFFYQQAENFSARVFAAFLVPFGILNLYILGAAWTKGIKFHYQSGITGNSNWTCAVTVVTMTVILYFIYGLLRKKFSGKTTSLLLLAPVGAAIYLWLFFHSMGSFLAVLGTLYLAGLLLIPAGKLRKTIFLYTLLAGILGTVFFVHWKQDAIIDRFATDERLSLWEGTVNMILANPVTGAGGFCCFENKIIPYRPLEYFLKSHVAARTSHPHNELLYILASGGLATGIPLLFLLLFPLFYLYGTYWKKRPSSGELLLYILYLYLILHGQVDCFFPKYPNGIFIWMLTSYMWKCVLVDHKKVLQEKLPEENGGKK